jgi:hypothetical protein
MFRGDFRGLSHGFREISVPEHPVNLAAANRMIIPVKEVLR